MIAIHTEWEANKSQIQNSKRKETDKETTENRLKQKWNGIKWNATMANVCVGWTVCSGVRRNSEWKIVKIILGVARR